MQLLSWEITSAALDRIVEKIDVDRSTPDGCWLWIGYRDPDGYGRFTLSTGHVRQAHQVVWVQEVGPLTPGLELDHLCANRACVRPDHLEEVDHVENVRRGALRRTQLKAELLATGSVDIPESL
jgi:hypothetical protein